MKDIGFKYWDLFEERIAETISSINDGARPPVRRIALHLTNRCNLGCDYCNERHNATELPFDLYKKIVREYSEMGGGVLHITGGEPTLLTYLSDAIEYTRGFENVKFHLNSNAIKRMTDDEYKYISRLKVSLDTHDADYFDTLVRRKGAFNMVIDNLQHIHNLASETPDVSITYTITKENYKKIPSFLKMYYEKFPNFYAAFFSCYKGSLERFVMSEEEIENFFRDSVPEIYSIMKENNDTESEFLFKYSHTRETFSHTRTRFEMNKTVPCYISMSELLINEHGDIWNCSHLFRDKTPSTGLNIRDVALSEIKMDIPCTPVHEKCLYGCNQKLVSFNKSVRDGLLTREVV